MAKIDREGIICPALKAAYERAMQKAFNKVVMPSRVNWPLEIGNSVSIKGTLEGADACKNCGKKIEVDLHLKKIDKATDQETGGPVTVYDALDFNQSIKISGTKCADFETQR